MIPTADLASLQSALADRYELEQELGSGGMASVYLARDLKLGRHVAIKVLRSDLITSASADRFLAEIRMAANLQHPHIVGLIDSGHVKDVVNGGERPYYVMPYVDGETLRARMARSGALPVADVVALLMEIADALDCAHRAGIVHRDIKPENILLSQRHALVADFGVAKALETSAYVGVHTTVGLALGTPTYMAPEQALGDPTMDHRVDLYALGVIGYEMLAGQPPFTGPTMQSVVNAHLTQPPRPISELRAETPSELHRLVMQLLSKEPTDRPAGADAVRDTLAPIAASQSFDQAIARGRPTWNKRHIAWALGAATVVATVTFAVITAQRARPSAVGAESRDAAPVARSLAILPFTNIGSDSAADYFGEGIADELLTALGRLPGLRVTSRTSSFGLKGKQREDAGRELGVTNLLVGSVRRSGQQVRVTVRLMDVAADSLVWAGEYNGELKDVFGVQDSIARAVVKELRLTLAGSSGGGPRVPHSTNPVAYDLYLRGRHAMRTRSSQSLDSAIAAFRGALALDSLFAPAHAGLADVYSLLASFGGRRPHDVFPLARQSALRALALDSTLSEAHTSLGIVAAFYDWKWDEAREHLRRGVELNGSSAEGHLFYAWYLLCQGRVTEAHAELATAHALDPFSIIISTRRGSAYWMDGDPRSAIPILREALQLDSTFVPARLQLAATLLATGGNRRDVLAALPQQEFLPGISEEAVVPEIFAKIGERERAVAWVKRMEVLSTTRYVTADMLAGGYVAIGETSKALDALEQAERDHAFTLIFMTVIPFLEPLRKEKRFQQLAARIGLHTR
ncbi:MAG: protein kinase [Gemmatimonadaceae bacterium]|nr:protein kinase [Gemmatimonadaceae bacterium]